MTAAPSLSAFILQKLVCGFTGAGEGHAQAGRLYVQLPGHLRSGQVQYVVPLQQVAGALIQLCPDTGQRLQILFLNNLELDCLTIHIGILVLHKLLQV